jgi:hypothetical protein
MSAKRSKLPVGCLIAAGVLALVLLTPPAYIIFSMLPETRRIRRIEAELHKPSVYEPVGKTLALCCQSDYQESEFKVPGELKTFALGPGFTMIDAHQALVELGGGFYHFGYLLQRDEHASSQETNVWLLYFASEDHPDKLLETFSLPTSARMATDELRKRFSQKMSP